MLKFFKVLTKIKEIVSLIEAVASLGNKTDNPIIKDVANKAEKLLMEIQ